MRVIKNTTKATIKIEKSPRDSKLKGNEIIEITGLIILNPIANSSPPNNKVSIPPCTTSPSKIIWVRYNAKA